MKPYTYLIGWSKHKIFYYGVRYSVDCHPSDLFETYFTSSRRVANFRKEHGDPDIIQVRKTFHSAAEARAYEFKVLKRMNVVLRPDFLNVAIPGYIPLELSRHLGSSNGMFGKKHSAATLRKLQGPKSEQHKAKMKKPRPSMVGFNSNNSASKPIQTPFGIFYSANHAAEILNLTYDQVRNRVRSKRKYLDWSRV